MQTRKEANDLGKLDTSVFQLPNSDLYHVCQGEFDFIISPCPSSWRSSPYISISKAKLKGPLHLIYNNLSLMNSNWRTWLVWCPWWGNRGHCSACEPSTIRAVALLENLLGDLISSFGIVTDKVKVRILHLDVIWNSRGVDWGASIHDAHVWKSFRLSDYVFCDSEVVTKDVTISESFWGQSTMQLLIVAALKTRQSDTSEGNARSSWCFWKWDLIEKGWPRESATPYACQLPCGHRNIWQY